MRILILLLFLCSCCNSKKSVKPIGTNAMDTLSYTSADGPENIPKEVPVKKNGKKSAMKNGNHKDEVEESPKYLEVEKPVVRAKTIKQKRPSLVKEQPTEETPAEPVEPVTSGLLKYDIPTTMNFRETYVLRIRINRDKEDDKAISVDMSANTKSTIIKTSAVMEVMIIDPSPADRKNFYIEKSDDAKQLVETTPGEFTEWIFNVTPLHTGKLKLNIVVSIIKSGNKKQVVYFHDVTVKASKWGLFKHWWNKYWQWLIGATLIPIIILVIKKRAKL